MACIPNSVNVVEVCRVAPASMSPHSTAAAQDQLTLSLTYFDLLWLRFPPVQRIYLYQLTSPFSTDSLVPKLTHSLSLVLQHFLPLAGNLTWPQDSKKPILRYVKGDAVSLTIAESVRPDDFDRLSSNDFLESKAYHPLVPKLDISHERAAAMALQVTLFPGRGFVVGTTMHHAILDGRNSTSFIKAWAHGCKHIMNGSSDESDFSLPGQLKPFYDRTVIHDPTGLDIESIYLNDWQKVVGPNNKSLMIWESESPLEDSVRGVFEFTRQKIQTLKQTVQNSKVFSEGSFHLSTFSLVCGYMWVCLAKSQELEGSKITLQGFPVDCRSRLDPPIPANYFGNCVTGAVAYSEAKEFSGEDGLAVAVKAISEAIKGLEKNGVLAGAEIWVSRLKDLVQTEGVYSTAGSPRFEIYDTDFGWGMPKKVEVVSIDRTGAISLSDSRNGGGGVEVGVVLRKHCMEAFAYLFDKGFEN